MITITHPFIEHRLDETFLCSKITDELSGTENMLWFSVNKQYGDYFCDDRVDAFLIIVLMIAMKSHQDIFLKAPVSRRLLFNINNTIQPLFSKMMPDSNCIKIVPANGYCNKTEGAAVGCGCSLGVDSLSALYKHLGQEVEDSYRVSHLALFNSGQLGYKDKEKDESTFREAVESIIPFSEETHLPIVAVNTNLNEYYVQHGFDTAVSRFVVSTISCPLALQKLFGKYVFASSYSVEEFEISKIDQSHFESAFVPLLSTESTEVILSNAVMTRVEKTDYIRNNPLTHKYLDVCWASQLASSKSQESKWLKDKTKKNCGWCDKCLRTLFTLELLGDNLIKYDELFDLPKYYANKDRFIISVLSSWHTNIMYHEVYQLMKEKGFKIKNKLLWKAYQKKFYSYLSKFLLVRKVKNMFQ